MAVSESGQGGLWASSYAEEQENAVIAGVSGKKVFVVDSAGNQVDFENALPTSGTNPSLVLGYDVDGNLITITKTINSVSYLKTLTYVANVLTEVSTWSEI